MRRRALLLSLGLTAGIAGAWLLARRESVGSGIEPPAPSVSRAAAALGLPLPTAPRERLPSEARARGLAGEQRVEQPPPRAGVLLRGTLTLVDDAGERHLREDGSFTLFALHERVDADRRVLRRLGGDRGGRELRVTRGSWEAEVAPDARLFLREVVLGGTHAVVEPLDELPLFTVPPDRRLDLRARALYPQRLRVVDAETGVELEDVRVLDRERILEVDDDGRPLVGARLEGRLGEDGARLDLDEVGLGDVEKLWPRSDELPGTWLRGDSPIGVPVERERLERRVQVHVPGYMLAAAQLDFRSRAEVEIAMARAGTLRARIGPCASPRVLRIHRPGDDARLAFGWHVPLFGVEEGTVRSEHHDWSELDGAGGVTLRSDQGGDLELEMDLVLVGSWRVTLAHRDGEGGYPPAMTEVIEELDVFVTAGETTGIELAGCD